MIRFRRALAVSLFALATLAAGPATAPVEHVNHAVLGKLAWQLAYPAWAVKGVPFDKMLEELHGLTVHHLELGKSVQLGQTIVPIDPKMSKDDVGQILAELKKLKMDIVSLQMDLPATEAEARAYFELAKSFKAKTIITTPAASSLPMLDSLAKEFNVNVAIFPKADSEYTSADALLKALNGLSPRTGVLLSPAHLKLRGESPLAVTKTLKGHIIALLVSDVDASEKLTPAGQGTAEVPLVLQELKDQKFKGVCTVAPGSVGETDKVDELIPQMDAFAKALGELK